FYNVAANEHFVYAVELDAKKLEVYPIAADGTLPATPTASLALENEPHALGLDPAGKFAFLATLDDASLRVFDVDAASGALSAKGEPLVLDGGNAGHVVTDPAGHRL